MSYRIEQINELIRDYLAKIITKEISFKKGIFVSISKVKTTKDLSVAKIFISVFPFKESDYAIKTLEKEIFKIQKKLNRNMQTKILPKISFILDESQEKISGIEEIFEKIKNEKK